jgi:LacI family transcriptional regulator
MKDIALRLGVSQATVSHVLRGRNDELRISAKTTERILKTAEELGYRPSALARNFKNHRSQSICLAVGHLNVPFWASVALGAQQESERHGYTLVVSHTGEQEEKERQVVEMLRERRVDGIILCPAHPKPDYLAALRADRLPFVFVDRTIAGFTVPSVTTDSVAGMTMAVDHLVGRGHRRIAYLGGPSEISTLRDRLLGYRRAMTRHHLTPGPFGVVPSDPEKAREEAVRLLAKRPRATAIVAAELMLAIGALRAAPDAVEVVGFDDFFAADLLRRPVTTIEQPDEELGRHAVRLLMEEIAKPGGDRQMVLPPRLIVRG